MTASLPEVGASVTYRFLIPSGSGEKAQNNDILAGLVLAQAKNEGVPLELMDEEFDRFDVPRAARRRIMALERNGADGETKH